jgi:hypothetical protein
VVKEVRASAGGAFHTVMPRPHRNSGSESSHKAAATLNNAHGARHIQQARPLRQILLSSTANMASRFFAASDSSSDESSEEELYSNGEESGEENSDKDSDSGSDDDDSSDSGSDAGGANRFLKDASSDSESDNDDGEKVLKSAKDKRFDELEATIRLIENAQKINDWAVISDRTSIPA